jgi:hypothetical protein
MHTLQPIHIFFKKKVLAKIYNNEFILVSLQVKLKRARLHRKELITIKKKGGKL